MSDQPDSGGMDAQWRWSRETDFEGSAANPGFPDQPTGSGLSAIFPILVPDGRYRVSKDEINGLMGLNWLRFYEHNFTPAVKSTNNTIWP